MRWIVLGVIGLAGGLATAAPVGTTVVLDRSVVRVGDDVIWQSDLDVRMRDVAEKDRPGVLDMMIDEALVVIEGKRANVNVEKSEIEAALAEIKQQNNLDDAALDKALAEGGYTRARYLVDLERQLLRLRTVYQLVGPRVTVTEAQVDAEAKTRGMKVPLSEDDKYAVRRDLHRKELDAETVKWIATLRKRALIERRP